VTTPEAVGEKPVGPFLEVEGFVGEALDATALPAPSTMGLREMRSEVLGEVLSGLRDAPDLASAACVVDACIPLLADAAGVRLLAGFIRGDDAAELVPGAGLLVRAPVQRAPLGAGPSGPGSRRRNGARGEAFQPRSALSATSMLREAMESQRVVRCSCPQPRSVASLATERDRGLSRTCRRGGELLAVPLICGDFTIGVLALLREPGLGHFSPSDVETAEQVAAVTALRLENLRLSARHAETAAALRSDLLPVVPVTSTGVEVAARYRAAHRGDGVGGDWAEMIRLPGGRTAFTVGDVMGHGVPAAVVMSVLQSVIQALAPLHLDPAHLLRHLDDLALQHQAARPQQPNWFATCLYAVYDPVTRECEIAGAGHPAPMLTTEDGTSRPLDIAPGTPIGVGAGRFRTVRVVIPDGSQLIFYTDGLIEVRGQDIEQGMTALGRRASAALRRPLEWVCQELMDHVAPSAHPDDIALLVARFHRLPPDRMAVLTLTGDPGLGGYAG
jgi:serine phosphatase RsbU (regulator of sigma subunit)